jgi:WD40 repeat protein
MLEGRGGRVISVTFSPDGKELASAPRDKTVQLWDTTRGDVLQTLESHASRVNSVAFPPDIKQLPPAIKQLASASHDGTVRL